VSLALLARSAGAQVPCSAVLVQPQSAELLQRIEGQSRDVACELRVLPADPVPEDDSACRALAAAHGAQGVLIVRGQPDNAASYELVVCGGEAEREHRAVRATGATSDALSTSALYEAVALVVRSALVDLDEALEAKARAAEEERRAALARVEAERAAERRANDEARARAEQEARDRDVVVDEAAQPDDLSSPANLDWLIMAGVDVAAIGADSAALELGARAAVDLGVLRLGLFGSYGLSAPLRDASTRVELCRHRAGLSAGLPVALSRVVVLEPVVLAGAAALERSSESRAASVIARGKQTTWSALFGAELGLSLRVVAPLGLRLHAGLDVLPGAPRYVYEDVLAGTSLRTERTPAHPLQPRAGAMLFGSF
jgi:hypothetical protein